MVTPRFIPWRESDRRYLAPMLVLALVFGLLFGTLYVVFRFVQVDGDSMLPVLRDGDRVLLTRSYDLEVARRGDIVSLTVPDRGRPVTALKRVIALPGDEVSATGDSVAVNGAPSTAAPDPIVGPDQRVYGTGTIPEGHLFVLGDNRPVSLDSRFVGPLPVTTVRGKAVAIIWPPSRIRLID